VFGLIHGLVQEGHDLRHVTGQVTNHFRNLLLALSSSEDKAILDVPAEAHGRLVAQAGKFSAAELNRILSLLLQAQTDLRWTTSPRLTIELALVRAALPETDPQPAALLARVERLERLAGLESPPTGAALGSAPVSVSPVEATQERSSTVVDEGHRREPEPRGRPEASGEPEPRGGPEASQEQAHAPSAGAVDTEMLRRSWPQVLDALKAKRKMRLFASSQLATVGSFDGQTLELVFPPGRDVGAAKVRELSGDLVEVLRELFGITPAITCTVREGAAVDVTDDEPPPSPEAAEALLRAQFGAELVEED
jgi:DNA polymerase III subunit gamma/tau